MLQSKAQRSPVGKQAAMHFGLFLKTLRHRYSIRQLQVLAHLPGWTQTTYSRLESGEIAPAFDQLAAIYAALHQAGAELTPLDRQQFLLLARKRIDVKKTYQEHKTEQDWEQLRLRLSRVGDTGSALFSGPVGRLPSRPRLVETRHLVGREGWLSSVIALLQETLPKKLIVLQGPIGIGKSSELHRLALYFLRQDTPRIQVILCDLPPLEPETEPETALDLFLGNLLAEIGPAEIAQQLPSLEARATFALQCLEKTARPLLLLLDHAERLLDERGALADCWVQFLLSFLRSQHRASLVIATREWPGWQEGERIFLTEQMIPPLAPETGALLLQNLGLTTVPLARLRKASEVVGGIPLCLEWIASLVQEPMLLDSWEGLDDLDELTGEDAEEDAQTQRLLRLLEDASLFGGPIASKLKPLLERIVQTHLSAEAVQVLHLLAIANIPLGKPALQKLCPAPRLLHELRASSLLVAYPRRIQLLPMVTSLVRARLTADQQRHLEEQLIEALTCWLDKGTMSHAEAGAIISELATLYLKHHHLLAAAELLIRYGWLSFNQGYAPRLAQLAIKVLQDFDWHGTEENECGGLILQHLLAPFLSQTLDYKKRTEDYQHIQNTILAKKVHLQPLTELHTTYYLVVSAIQKSCFEAAQVLLDTWSTSTELSQIADLNLYASLLEKQAWLLSKWSEYAEEHGERQKAMELREQVITIYRQSSSYLLGNQKKSSPLEHSLLKKRLARSLNNLSYHLNRAGQYEEALQSIEQSIILREQGYVQIGELASSYSEKSQALAGLGRFQEALQVDEKALVEIRECINAGHMASKEEVWIYTINRGRLYLRIGKIDEAEQLLREALSHVQPGRRVYQMLAKEALEEIKQWRQRKVTPHQLDWRWIERYRGLDAFDAYWWWAQAGPFNTEEQRLWHHIYKQDLDEGTKSQLGKLIAQSRERELVVAASEQREPHLHYPALDVEEVRRRIAGMLQLDAEINQEEPNAIVRRLYHGAIEEEVCFLHMIEATYEQSNERFQEFNQCVDPVPTPEEMAYALSRLGNVLMQGFLYTKTREASQQVSQFLREHLQLSLDLAYHESEAQEEQHIYPSVSKQQPMVSPQAAKRFFETILQESGLEDWQVIIDPKASGPYVEAASRRLFLQDKSTSLDRIRHYLAHELAGHVVRSVAGEYSLLGLLAIGTKGYLPVEEGLALYNERQVAVLHQQVYNDWGIWIGTLATGLASGVITPPQTFLPLYTFFTLLFLLRRLLEYPGTSTQEAQEKARKMALARCLRTYRGVPDLQKAGVCFGKDAAYLRGIWMIERAVAEDETILDRLAVGKVGLDQLSDLQELGIVAPPQPLRKLLLDPNLDAYILSFDKKPDGQSDKFA